MATKKLRIAAIGDLHVQETDHGRYQDLFAEINEQADLLVLCGDLTNLGLPAEAANLADDLRVCRLPVIGVLGNHDYHSDQEQSVKQILIDAGLHFLEGSHYELNGVGFAGVKGFAGGFGQHALGAFGEKLMKAFVQESVNEALLLEHSLQELATKKKVVVLHYSPIPETLAGEAPEVIAFLGSAHLTDTINRYEVDHVFHGHAHKGKLEGKTDRGVIVHNCAVEVLAQHHLTHLLYEV